MRAKKDILNTFVVAGEGDIEFLASLLQEAGIPDATRLIPDEFIPYDIEPQFVIPFSAAVARVELTKRQLINFRKGEFIYRGEYEYLKGQLIKYGIGVVIVVLFSILLVVYKFRMLSRYEEQLNSTLAEVTKQILGKPYDNFTTALAVIKGKTEPKNFSIPRTSAFDYFMYISDSFPEGIDVDIRTIEIGDKKIRIEGETDSFEAVDRLVGELKKNSCFKDIAKGKVKKTPDGKRIDFDLSITPSC
jgi:general secretion pathway protein L